MFGIRHKDDLDVFDALLLDDRFWKSYQKSLIEQLSPKFEQVFLAGMYAGATVPVREAIATKAQPLEDEGQRQFTDKELANIAETAIKGFMPTWSNGITGTTYESVRKAVLASREDGSGVEGVLKRIGPMFGDSRAQMIAVTETTRLFGMGSQAMYRARGITGWEWETANDPWVDKKECVQRQGNQYPISEEFQPAHPRCRCWPAPVMLDEPSRVTSDIQKWAENLTRAERETLREYTTEDYKLINKSLRKDDRVDWQRVGYIDSAISSYRTDKELTVYRGITLKDPLKTGDTLSDKAFVSTTLSRKTALQKFSSKHVFEITLPVGTHAAPIGAQKGLNLSLWEEEREIILPRGSTLRVTGVRFSGDTRIYSAEYQASAE